MTTIPTIDLQRLAPGADDREATLDILRRTVGTIGAFYLVGHGVPAEAGDRLFALSRKFFALPEAERRSIEMAKSPHFRGYTALGNELTQGRPDWREEVDIGAELPSRQIPDGPPYWGLQGPNQWPAALPELRPPILDWLERLQAVASELTKALAESLGLARNRFDDAFNPDPHLLLSLFAILDDASRTTGKESAFIEIRAFSPSYCKTTSGIRLTVFNGQEFVDVLPQRGAFVINLGEALELATGHRLRATLHRVQSPPEGHNYFSIPFFYNPRFDYVVEPIEFAAHVLPPHDLEAVDPANPIFAEYGYNALKGRLRSHRDVAERFYHEVDKNWSAFEAQRSPIPAKAVTLP